MNRKSLIAIVGPTAVGKTSLSIALAQEYKTIVLSFDSRQCYKELSIGTAKPSADEQQKVPHFFINTHSIHENVTVKTFETYADNVLENCFHANDYAVTVGGSGLFLDTLLYGLDDIPAASEEIIKKIRHNYTQKGISWLKEELEKRDILYAQYGEMKNPQRMMRALSVHMATGKSIIFYRTKKKKKETIYRPVFIGIKPRNSEELLKRITERIDSMIEKGLEKEVKSLQSFSHYNALNTVGYKEWKSYFENNCPLDDVRNEIIRRTKQYAKKQVTWFKSNKDIRWFNIDEPLKNIKEYISKMNTIESN